MTYYSGDKPTVECLWIVTVSGSNYSFESVSLKNKEVENRNVQGQDGTRLQVGGTGSPFVVGTRDDVTNVANQVTGRFYYIDKDVINLENYQYTVRAYDDNSVRYNIISLEED